MFIDFLCLLYFTLSFQNRRILRKDRMKLYRHLLDCKMAMKCFLRANPLYWAFVPMTIEQAQRSNENDRIDVLSLLDETLKCTETRSKIECDAYVLSLPKPPMGYSFSNRQQRQQYEFFKYKLDVTGPDIDNDLYKATILSVCMLSRLNSCTAILCSSSYSSTRKMYKRISIPDRIHVHNVWSNEFEYHWQCTKNET